MREEWVIFWRHPELGTHDMEYFDDETAARNALADFSKKYPWNRYTLARIAEIVNPTTKYTPTINYSAVDSDEFGGVSVDGAGNTYQTMTTTR